MTRHVDPARGSHVTPIAAEVRAEAYHEKHIPEPAEQRRRIEAEQEQASGTPGAAEKTPEGTTRTNRIIVGVDGSAGAHTALLWAADEAKLRGAELVVVQAWVPQGPMAGPMIAPGADLWAETIERTREQLMSQVESLEDSGVTVTTQLVGGPPHEALEALSGEADLLVVGSRGRGPIGSAVLGSVSSHVCRSARCPVVVVSRHAAVPAETE